MDIPNLIGQIHSALEARIGRPGRGARGAAQARGSDQAFDYAGLSCLFGRKRQESFKSLKRHLRTQYNMTPDQYREKWGLPPDYSMVAPNYAAARSQLAKQMGLGQQRRRRRERG